MNSKKNKVSSFFYALMLLMNFTGVSAFAGADDSWGDMGYAKPTTTEEAQPVSSSAVEPIMASPQATSNATDDAAAEEKRKNSERVSVMTLASSAETAPETPSNDSMVSSSGKIDTTTTNVSTVHNTYGVETQENAPVRLYVSPFAGVTSDVGNSTVSTSPQYAAGATVGLLLSDNLMLNVSYTYSQQGVSNPTTTTFLGGFAATNTDVFNLKTNSFDAGVKLYFLGRESKFRPYFGAGFGYAKSFLNYQADYLASAGNQGQTTLNDFDLSQFTGYGELGLEYAFNRTFVAVVSGRLDGVISSSSSATSDPNATADYDANKLAAGNSLSRSTSYSLGLGVGFYF